MMVVQHLVYVIMLIFLMYVHQHVQTSLYLQMEAIAMYTEVLLWATTILKINAQPKQE